MTVMNWNDRLRGAFRRRLARCFGRRAARFSLERSIISFTFDDFPRSAYECGGAILRECGAFGTYYTSLGLAGATTASGRMFDITDLEHVYTSGHELGCHTFHHLPAWSTAPSLYQTSIEANAAALQKLLPTARFHTHSYPIEQTRPVTKRIASRYFACCRSGGQRANVRMIDLNYVSAFFLEQAPDPDTIKRIIDRNALAVGWLVFATHDVSPNPTRYGCLQRVFQTVVEYAVQSGAEIAPVAQALRTLRMSDAATTG